MSKVVPLIGFGFGLIAIGAYFSLYNDSLSYFTQYIINDEYYILQKFIWDVIPVVVLLIGIMCLIAAGVTARSSHWEGGNY